MIRDVLDTARRHRGFHVCPDIYAFTPGGGEYLESFQDKLVFGTAYRFSTIAEPLEETLKLPVKPAVLEKCIWGNGVRLLKVQESQPLGDI